MAQHWLIERGGRCFAAMLLVLTAVLAFGSLTAEAAKPRVAIVGFTSRVQKTDITLTDLKEPLPYLLTAAREQLTAIQEVARRLRPGPMTLVLAWWMTRWVEVPANCAVRWMQRRFFS